MVKMHEAIQFLQKYLLGRITMKKAKSVFVNLATHTHTVRQDYNGLFRIFLTLERRQDKTGDAPLFSTRITVLSQQDCTRGLPWTNKPLLIVLHNALESRQWPKMCLNSMFQLMQQ